MNVSLYQAASALNANSQWLDVISENLGSTSIPGFRKQSLATEAMQAGLVPGSTASGAAQYFSMPEPEVTTSFQPGEMNYTGNDKNAGIDGKGFFQVKLPDGTPAVTRDGEFHVNAKGELTTKEGYVVEGKTGQPIHLDVHNQTPLAISASGEVSQGEQVVGSLNLVDYENPQLLTPTNGVYFLANNPALVPQPVTGTVQQGVVENANTNSMTEMASLMTAMRTFEANQHVVQIQDERLGKVVSELGGTS